MAEDRVSHTFLLQGIQHWGQTAEQREKATRDYVEAAGLRFGSNEANEWLSGVLKTLRRGEFNSEVRQLQDAIAERHAIAKGEDDDDLQHLDGMLDDRERE